MDFTIKTRSFASVVILGCLILLLGSPRLCAKTLYVNTNIGNDDWTGSEPQLLENGVAGPKATIQAAVNVANSNDEIIIAPGLYKGHGNRDISIENKVLTIRSENGLGSVTIDCEGTSQASHHGFNIYNVTSQMVLEGIIVINGRGLRGGGVHCINSDLKITHCIFSGHIMNSGGAIYSSGSDVVIDRCGIWGNQSLYSGGGVDSWFSRIKISNSVICGNRASDYGAGVSSSVNSDVEIVNCTISQNVSSFYGGGIFVRHGSTIEMDHSILYSNRAEYGNEMALINRSGRPSSISVKYSDVEGGQENAYSETGTVLDWKLGNIDQDPLFISPGYWNNSGTEDKEDDLWVVGNMRLQAESPCIDLGHALYQPEIHIKDFSGFSRMINGWVDLGAHEYHLEADWVVDDDASYDPGPGDPEISYVIEDGSINFPFDTLQEAIDIAQPGDRILVRDGIYTGPGNRDLKIIEKPLMIYSENNAKRSIIDCENLGQGFFVDQLGAEELLIDGLTIRNGWAKRGGAIYSRNSSINIQNCRILNNLAISCGGGIYCEGDNLEKSYPLILNNEISGNRSYGPGGGLYVYYFNIYPNIMKNLVSGNHSQKRGGGVSILALNSDATIINNTITSNKADSGGGVSFHASNDSVMKNCIVWGNQAEIGENIEIHQFGELFASQVAIDYCDFENLESNVPVSNDSVVDWGNNNIANDPCFVQPGYFLDNDTPQFAFDDIWVPGNYQLNFRSNAIDNGDNGQFLASVVDPLSDNLVFNNRIDLGAFEYQGIDPGLSANPREIDLTKVSVKAGKKEITDSFTVAGLIDTTLQEVEVGTDLTIRVGPFVETLASESIDWSRTGDKFSYKGRSKEGVNSLKVDIKKGTFLVSAKNIDLTGLTEPMLVEFSFGSYRGFGSAFEDVINAKKVVPMSFVSGFSDTLILNSVDLKSSRSRGGSRMPAWTLKGGITLDESVVNLRDHLVHIKWGDFETTLQGWIMKDHKSGQRFQYKGKKTDQLEIKTLEFDFQKNSFEIEIHKNIIQSFPIEFQLTLEDPFGGGVYFNKTQLVEYPLK